MSAGICEHCKSGFILPGEPKGSILENGAYFIAGNDSTRAIILLTDAFGLPLKNNKILADQFAEQVGCDVWVPDVFNGTPHLDLHDMDSLPQKAGVPIPFTVKLGLVYTVLKRIPRFIRNRPSVVDARVLAFISNLKEEKRYAKLGAVGYCFGGRLAIIVGSKDLVDTVVIIHPGGTSIEDIKAIRTPALWQCAEDDMSFGPKIRNEAEAVFEDRKGKPEFVEYEFKDYKGTVHGFAARPALDIPEIKAAFEECLTDGVNWFKRMLAA